VGQESDSLATSIELRRQSPRPGFSLRGRGLSMRPWTLDSADLLNGVEDSTAMPLGKSPQDVVEHAQLLMPDR